LAAGGLRWHSVQSERATVAAALARTVDAEGGADAPNSDLLTTSPAQEQQRLAQSSMGSQAQDRPVLAQSLPYGDAITRLQWLDRDVAMVEVVLPGSHDQPALRQTRVYRLTGSDWVRMEPAAVYWGVFHKWTGDHLRFLYYAHDAQAVAEVAAQLDARYAELHRLFLGEAPSQPLTVVVDPAQAPGQIASRTSVSEPLVVASPAAYLAPETISDAELLAQSVLLALLDELAGQALMPDADIANAQDAVRRTRVGQLLEGVRLWQLWQGDLPLARWRKPVVQWVFSDARASRPVPGEVVPPFHAELCAMHRLWMPTTLALDLPLTCLDTWDSRGNYLSWRRSTAPPQRLAQLPLMIAEQLMWEYYSANAPLPYPAAEVALATVLEYAADTYGPDRIPMLLAEASRHEGWATLIPVVFGVSIEEFEAGWRTYLAERYSVPLDELP
jgi:hypothetical protein